MFREVFSLCICAAVISPICDANAFWGSEKITPKAERAKKVLEGFDAVIENSMRDYKIPGAVVGIVVDGSVIYAKPFGVRDLEKKLPVTADTQFLLGSLSKAFTSFTIGCLVDEGLMGWDDKMVDLIPEFRLSDQYVTQILTVRELLSHQTQLPRHDYMWYNENLSRSELLHKMRYLDFASDTSDHFHYNNMTYMVVEMAAERMANKTFEELVSQKILQPLKMTHTGFCAADMQKSSDYSYPYVEKDSQMKRMKFRNFDVVGQGMYSNLSDLCRWVQLQLKHGEWQQKPLLSLATFKELQAPQVVATGYPESKDEQVRAYGFGWYIQSYMGMMNIVHDGALDGFTTAISLLPQKDIGVVVLCNRNLTAWPRLVALEVFDRVMEMPHGEWFKEGLEGIAKNNEMIEMMRDTQKETANRKKGTHPSHPLEEYVGEYQHPAYGTIQVDCVDNALQATYHDLTFQLEHWHYDVFNICGESDDTLISLKNVKFTFQNNLNGDICEISAPFEQKASDIIFKRKPSNALNATAYLRQFAGIYEIYSYTVEIMLRNQALYAVIPGQPLYELVPNSQNDFSIKSLTGFTVRFVMDPNNQVQEVLLIQPYGVVYTAKPKR